MAVTDPRIDALNILTTDETKAKLALAYKGVIDNIAKETISAQLKNDNLSGDPASGTVQAKRFENSNSAAYGTARSGQKGAAVKAAPVDVKIDTNREIIEEVENKDLKLYGVDGLISRRTADHQSTMKRELERAFFTKQSKATSVYTTKATAVQEALEEVVQKIETTKNKYVDGVDRDMIAVVCNTATYGKIRAYLDGTQNANVDTDKNEFGYFHGIKVYSSVYLPTTVDMIASVKGSTAMPVLPSVANPEKIQFSDAYGFGIFYYYGVENVMPDLIVPAKLGVAGA